MNLSHKGVVEVGQVIKGQAYPARSSFPAFVFEHAAWAKLLGAVI